MTRLRSSDDSEAGSVLSGSVNPDREERESRWQPAALLVFTSHMMPRTDGATPDLSNATVIPCIHSCYNLGGYIRGLYVPDEVATA